MKIRMIACLLFCVGVVRAQEAIQVKYKISFNNQFDRPVPDIREFLGVLDVKDESNCFFYMLPQYEVHSSDTNIDLPQDTVWRIAIDRASSVLAFDDLFNPGLRPIWYTDSLFPMDWHIAEDTKSIDSILCQRADCSFRGRDYVAWFSPLYPLPFGPWKLGGLPGLILELSESNGDLTATLLSISPAGNVGRPSVQGKPYTEYLRIGTALRKLMRSNSKASDCLDCDSKVKFYSWEKVFPD